MERLSKVTNKFSVRRCRGLAILQEWRHKWGVGLTMAVKNAHDGISVISTAEGAMEEITAMLENAGT